MAIAPLSRRQRIALAAIVACGLALRLVVVWEQHDDVLFEYPTVDAERYVREARALAAGRFDESQRHAYWQPPGTMYALAGVFRVAGPGLVWPRVVQCALSAACVLMAFALARRFASDRVALAAAAIVALHGVLIHAASELLPGVWIGFFDLAGVLTLVIAAERRAWAWAWATGAGLLLGVAAICSPLILPFVPIAALWLWRNAKARRAVLVATLLAGTALPVVGVAIRNYRVDGNVVLVSTNGGLNFYIGNNERYLDTLAVRPGIHWEELSREPEREGIHDPAAISSYFYRKGGGYFARAPASAVAGVARKLYLFWNGGEIPRSTDLYAARSQSTIVAALVWPAPLRFPSSLLLPLALVGIVVTWRRDPRARLVAVFIGTHALVVAMFFVTSRYRLPVVPMLAVFAVLGAAWLVERVRAGPTKQRVLTITALAALVAALNLPTRETEMSYRAELEFYRGITFARQRGDLARGVRHLTRATELDPDDPRGWFELGNVLVNLDREPEAIAAWERAAHADPWDTRPRRRIALVLATAGDYDGAARALRASIAAGARDPAHYAHEHYTIGTLEAAAGRFGPSLAALRIAASLDVDYVREHAADTVRYALDQPAWGDGPYWLGLGDLLRDAGLTELARSTWQRAATQDPASRAQAEQRLGTR